MKLDFTEITQVTITGVQIPVAGEACSTDITIVSLPVFMLS